MPNSLGMSMKMGVFGAPALLSCCTLRRGWVLDAMVAFEKFEGRDEGLAALQ
jgi:hypothetical protein